MVDPVITRRLGTLENFYRSRTASGFFRNFQVTATYSRQLDTDLVYWALRKTLIDYHLLICNVFKDHTKGYSIYRPIAHVTLGELFETTSDEAYLDGGIVSEKFMKHATDDYVFSLYVEKPLFKTILVDRTNLCVVFEHTIADGVVGNNFHEIFLDNLAYVDNDANKLVLEKDYGIDFDSPITLDTTIFDYKSDEKYLRNSLPPPIEYFMDDYNLDYSYGDPNYYGFQKPQGYTEKWKGRFLSGEGELSIGYKFINLAPEELKVILAKCKQYGVTVTSYIEVNLALTLQPVFGDDHYIGVLVAITLRRFMDAKLVPEEYTLTLTDPNHKILGTHAHGGIAQNIPPLKTFSWEFVQKVNENLRQSVSNRRLLNLQKPFFDIAHDLDDNESFFTKALGKPKVDTAKISNLGFIKSPVHEIPGKEPWTITNFVFAQDMSPTAAEFMLNVISTPAAGMNLVLSFFDHSFDDTEFDNFNHFMGIFKKNLINNAN